MNNSKMAGLEEQTPCCFCSALYYRTVIVISNIFVTLAGAAAVGCSVTSLAVGDPEPLILHDYVDHVRSIIIAGVVIGGAMMVLSVFSIVRAGDGNAWVTITLVVGLVFVMAGQVGVGAVTLFLYTEAGAYVDQLEEPCQECLVDIQKVFWLARPVAILFLSVLILQAVTLVGMYKSSQLSGRGSHKLLDHIGSPSSFHGDGNRRHASNPASPTKRPSHGDRRTSDPSRTHPVTPVDHRPRRSHSESCPRPRPLTLDGQRSPATPPRPGDEAGYPRAPAPTPQSRSSGRPAVGPAPPDPDAYRESLERCLERRLGGAAEGERRRSRASFAFSPPAAGEGRRDSRRPSQPRLPPSPTASKMATPMGVLPRITVSPSTSCK